MGAPGVAAIRAQFFTEYNWAVASDSQSRSARSPRHAEGRCRSALEPGRLYPKFLRAAGRAIFNRGCMINQVQAKSIAESGNRDSLSRASPRHPGRGRATSSELVASAPVGDSLLSPAGYNKVGRYRGSGSRSTTGSVVRADTSRFACRASPLPIPGGNATEGRTHDECCNSGRSSRS